ncbi:MAG: CPBP family intramembrane metalloprotease [Ruminococcus sp.]|nr:CPBP family intramembrane metalloprotease [Ruminococcus sp.]
MKRLFEKNEVTFAVVMIVIYVIGESAVQGLSESAGIQFLGETVFGAAMSAVLLGFIKKNGLTEYLGLCRPETSAKDALYYIPVWLIALGRLFFGAAMQYSPVETLLHTAMMLFVGFLEEIVFRGLLFKGIAKRNVKRAIVISSVTFGIGHIVNLLNGYDIFDNICQIIYAVAVGFMLVFIFMRTGSVLPCVAFHCLNNMTSAFASGEWLINAVGSEQTADLIMIAVFLIISVVYTVYILKRLPKKELKTL